MFYNRNNYYDSMRAMISLQDAIQIALNHIYGQPIKAELNREQSVLVYEVEIIDPQGRRYEIDIDAFNGNVVNVEIEN